MPAKHDKNENAKLPNLEINMLYYISMNTIAACYRKHVFRIEFNVGK
jgi:hypothetical protein